ncbi:pulmonary surfactant-associated protein D-like [Anolis sagrei]|uniref:pulmonary surfactant-associated protein D-like n=1 Tax=Anolis sagrei TaxID=38937 RepID=UPI003520F237
MLLLVTLCALVLCVLPETTVVPQQVVQTCDPKACSLVVCGPAERGLPGRDGRDGLQGPKGEKGEQGLQGPKGILGPPGKMGPAGPAGMTGAKGDVGNMGLQGATGPQGLEGRRGPPGSKGDKGYTGERGTKGDSGLSEVNLLKNRVIALEGQLNALQASFSKYQKVAAYPVGQIVGNKVFATSGYEGNFHDLKWTCQQAGGQLASPRNAAENTAIQQITILYKMKAFLGITDIQTEGTFKYLNSETIVYSNWITGEPSNYRNNEDCVEIRLDGKWNDIPCTDKTLMICEF